VPPPRLGHQMGTKTASVGSQNGPTKTKTKKTKGFGGVFGGGFGFSQKRGDTPNMAGGQG